MKRLWYVIPIALVLYLLVAIGVRIHNAQAEPCYTSAFVTVTPTQEVFYRNVKLRVRNASCTYGRRIYAASLRYVYRHGGIGDGDFIMRASHAHCWAHGNVSANIGLHVDCRSMKNARVSYTVT